jgi:hypothetical protein
MEIHREYCSACKSHSFVDDEYGLVCCSLNDGSGKPSLRSRNYHLKSQENRCIDCLDRFEADGLVWAKRLESNRLVPIALCTACISLSPEQRKERRKRNQRRGKKLELVA